MKFTTSLLVSLAIVQARRTLRDIQNDDLKNDYVPYHDAPRGENGHGPRWIDDEEINGDDYNQKYETGAVRLEPNSIERNANTNFWGGQADLNPLAKPDEDLRRHSKSWLRDSHEAQAQRINNRPHSAAFVQQADNIWHN